MIEQLRTMQDDSLRGEVLRLRKQIQEEKAKREKIDTLLSQARKISSEGNEKTEGNNSSGNSELKDNSYLFLGEKYSLQNDKWSMIENQDKFINFNSSCFDIYCVPNGILFD